MLPIIQIGPLAVQTPGLIILIGLWLGLNAAERTAANKNINPERIYNLTFISLISGILGARLGYAALFPQIFLENPTSLISLNLGLLDLWSGIAVGFIVGLIYWVKKELPVWTTLDVLTPMLGIVLVSLSLANLASGNGYGAPSNLPWAIHLLGIERHPSQIYETIAGLFILWIVWPGKRLSKYPKEGVQFALFIVLFTSMKLFLEAFRGDSEFIFLGIRTNQVIYWIILALSLWLSGKRLRTMKPVKKLDGNL